MGEGQGGGEITAGFRAFIPPSPNLRTACGKAIAKGRFINDYFISYPLEFQRLFPSPLEGEREFSRYRIQLTPTLTKVLRHCFSFSICVLSIKISAGDCCFPALLKLSPYGIGGGVLGRG
jgi:hypothetical protein